MGIPMDIMRPDPGLYNMSTSEMMALFNDGGVDVNSLFPTDFQQQHGSDAGFPKMDDGIVSSP
jgi:hypothetical protein